MNALSASLPIILPFFRASVGLRESDQAVWDEGLEDDAFAACLRSAPAPFCHNLRRLMVACEVAVHEQAELVLAEGWKSNVLVPGEAPVCGAEVGERMIRLLQARDLTRFSGTIHRLDTSCCTWQEILVVHAAFPGRRIIGVTSSPCPSAARARRYLRLITGEPAEVRSEFDLDARAQAVCTACATPAGLASEAVNWAVHAGSELTRAVWRSDRPLEMRLAQALRR